MISISFSAPGKIEKQGKLWLILLCETNAVCISIYPYIYIYIYILTHVYICIYTHIHMYIYIHIHTYVCVYETTVSSFWTSSNKGQWCLRDEKQCNFQYFPSLLLGERIVHYGEVGFITRTQVGFTVKNNQCNS